MGGEVVVGGWADAYQRRGEPGQARASVSVPRVVARACRSRSAACAISINGCRFTGEDVLPTEQDLALVGEMPEERALGQSGAVCDLGNSRGAAVTLMISTGSARRMRTPMVIALPERWVRTVRAKVTVAEISEYERAA